MSAGVSLSALPPFKNEPYTDFSTAANRAAMEAALQKVRGELDREYPLLIAGERVTTGDLLVSRNPSRPAEIVGRHHKATRELATRAIETAYKNFAAYSQTAPEDRVRWLLRAAAILRERKFEFDAWLVVRSRQDLAGSRGRGRRSHRLLRILRAPDAALRRADAAGADAGRARRLGVPAAGRRASSFRRGIFRWRFWRA